MILVANRHHYRKGPHDRAEYVGRGTAVGNPFVIGKDGTREEVIARFHHELRRAWKQLPNEIDKYSGRPGGARAWLERMAEFYVHSAHDLVLVCSCSPQACHAEVLALAVEKIAVPY